MNKSHRGSFVTRGTLASPTSTPDMSQKSRLSLVGFCRDLELQIYRQMRSEVYSLGIVLLGSQPSQIFQHLNCELGMAGI